jgi:hypothetical protein
MYIESDLNYSLPRNDTRTGGVVGMRTDTNAGRQQTERRWTAPLVHFIVLLAVFDGSSE